MIYNLIKDMLPNLNPRIIICDFEKANLNAVRSNFLRALIQGCYFHFSQCIWRKIGELGLKTSYINDTNVNMYCRSLLALAFMPLNDVRMTFEELSIDQRRPNCLNPLYQYFVNTFLGDNYGFNEPMFPYDYWRIIMTDLKEVPKTNNGI